MSSKATARGSRREATAPAAGANDLNLERREGALGHGDIPGESIIPPLRRRDDLRRTSAFSEARGRARLGDTGVQQRDCGRCQTAPTLEGFRREGAEREQKTWIERDRATARDSVVHVKHATDGMRRCSSRAGTRRRQRYGASPSPRPCSPAPSTAPTCPRRISSGPSTWGASMETFSSPRLPTCGGQRCSRGPLTLTPRRAPVAARGSTSAPGMSTLCAKRASSRPRFALATFPPGRKRATDSWASVVLRGLNDSEQRISIKRTGGPECGPFATAVT